MTRTLELPDAVFGALERAAEAQGTTPAGWIEQRLGEAAPAEAEPSPTEGRTLADRFAGRLGRISSEGVAPVAPEEVGAEFARYLEEKRGNGCL